MPNTVQDLKDKALDTWRRAPTVVIAGGVLLLILCGTCCLCSGCFSRDGDAVNDTPPERQTQVGTGLTAAAFEAEIKDKVISKSGFYRTYGSPDRTTELGVYTFLHYTCLDGRVKVKCRKAAFEERDEVSTVELELD